MGEAPTDAIWYFGYGSNMCRAIFFELRGMKPLATRWGWLHDHRLCFNLPIGSGERGVANLTAEPGARTCGVLYLLTAEDCDRLDNSEGVHAGFYSRVPVRIIVDGADPVSAFTYQSTFGTEGRKPSARYLGLLLDGARENALPEEYVEFLRRFELALDERETSPSEAPAAASLSSSRETGE